MSDLLSPAADRVLDAITRIDDPVLAGMEDRAERSGFPTVGPAAGRFLRLLVRAAGVSRVFECGSGFGYSAYWMATALPSDGEIVLTELDRDELADARSYFEDGGLADRARFEHGDALDLLAESDDTYDLILIDHQKEAYPAGYELARDRIRPGGIVVADNACETASYGPADVAAALEGERSRSNVEGSVGGVAEYYRRMLADDAFETALVPLGEGLLVSVRRADR